MRSAIKRLRADKTGVINSLQSRFCLPSKEFLMEGVRRNCDTTDGKKTKCVLFFALNFSEKLSEKIDFLGFSELFDFRQSCRRTVAERRQSQSGICQTAV